ncbi:MAG: glutathione synthase [Gammaproteobacteria bacterium]|nr:glutathione synthase [Gammaproteobacteria bacterium]
MSIKLAVVMDPITSINPPKDTTFAIMLEAQRRNWEVHVMEQKDLFLKDGVVSSRCDQVKLYDNSEHWFDIIDEKFQELKYFDIILMRKDPPFNTEYVYTTYLLELAEKSGVKVFNKPQSLRDANEKLFIAWFPQCTPPTLVTRNANQLKDFIDEHKDVVLKPLDGMGGGSIFRLTQHDVNKMVVIETLTKNETSYIMAQKFIPEISQGDKRIIMINGEPISYALARIPKAGEIRGNLAAGGTGVGVELTERDHWICSQVGPTLREKKLLLVGLDVIGDYLTEINVTSPTCVRELEKIYGINICADFLDAVTPNIG